MNYTSYDFIFITQTRWDDVSSTSFSLAQEFAKSNRVFLIDKPFTWKDVLTKRTHALKYRLRRYLTGRDRFRKLPNAPENLTLIIPPPSIPINWLPKGRLYEVLRKFNEAQLHKTIRAAARKFSISKYILFNSFNTNYSLNFPTDIRASIKIYQSVDSMANARYLSKHGVYRELEIAREADVFLGTSKEICRHFTGLGFPIVYLPNAANVDSFIAARLATTDRPPELAAIGKPIIGYIGSIDDRLDYDLLNELATRNPDKAVVLLGPMRKSAGPIMATNIVCIGLKPISQLPLYAKYMDCTIIPFKRTGFTKSIYPLKINEYLAAGRPVVVTPFSEEMDDFRTVARVAYTTDEFIAAVEAALITNTSALEEERINHSMANSWSNRTKQFWKILKNNGVQVTLSSDNA